MGYFLDSFSQDMVLGHLPYAPFFDPGPAYNNIGPAPILSTGATGRYHCCRASRFTHLPPLAVLNAMSFGFDRNIKTPYMENYNLNIQQQLTNKTVLQIGYVDRRATICGGFSISASRARQPSTRPTSPAIASTTT